MDDINKTYSDLQEIIPDEILDCTGLYCPAPVFETRKKIDSIGKGKVLQIIADDPASEEDIKSWSKTTGNELLKIEKDSGRFIFYIRKKH
ncbi:MAG: sulfurtransferase TusA family protein [Actinobacteria bacterium]|nr:sulfurtransferase TusA family protein [Actinomycetota bacterium]